MAMFVVRGRQASRKLMSTIVLALVTTTATVSCVSLALSADHGRSYTYPCSSFIRSSFLTSHRCSVKYDPVGSRRDPVDAITDRTTS